MANYFVASGGSNTAPYDTWAKAATSLQTALTAANVSGDIVVLQYDGVPSGDAEVAADTTYTFAANISLICSTNSGTSTITPTVQGVANWVGNSTTFRTVTLTGAFKVAIFGLTIRISGGTSDLIIIGPADGVDYELTSCYLWQGNTATASTIQIGTSSGSFNCFVKLKNSTLRFGGTAQSLSLRGTFVMEGGSVSSAGSAPTTFTSLSVNAGQVVFDGVDLSHLGSGTLIASAAASAHFQADFIRCKLGTGYVALATQVPANRGAAHVFIFDCSSGNTHGLMEHHNAFGYTVSDTGIYYTSGAAAQSWKIVTTPNCSYSTPYLSPWLGYYNTGTSAITPYVEILRDGSTTAYDNDEVWIEVSAKTTTGSTQATFYDDKMALAGSAAAQDNGAGLGSWTGESGTAWSGKIGLGSSITPAEVGHIQARIVVGEPSITVYADPQIRT